MVAFFDRSLGEEVPAEVRVGVAAVSVAEGGVRDASLVEVGERAEVLVGVDDPQVVGVRAASYLDDGVEVGLLLGFSRPVTSVADHSLRLSLRVVEVQVVGR